MATILHQNGNHFVLRTAKGFEVCRNEATHSIVVARIGYTGEKGRQMAIAECTRRELIITPAA